MDERVDKEKGNGGFAMTRLTESRTPFVGALVLVVKQRREEGGVSLL
jgi:hypothetical protein